MRRYSVKVKFDKLLIVLAILVFSINTIQGVDLLSPSELGESMGMPLPQDLVQMGISAGITKSPSQIAESLPSTTSDSLGTSVTAPGPLADSGSEQASEKELNVSGTLSLILQDKAVNYLNLELHQSDASILGHGNMISGNSLQNVTASGLVENGKLSLTIAPDGSSELYSLELQPEGNTIKGSYNVHSADGATWSGTAIGIIPDGAVNLQPPQQQMPQNSVAAVGVTRPSSSTKRSEPVHLGQGSLIGSTFSSSESISMSSGGSMVSSMSSTSF